MMKSILTTLALSAAPLWLSGIFPGTGERDVAVRGGDKPACCKIVSTSTAIASSAVVLATDVVKTDGDAPRAVVVRAGTPRLISASAIAGQTITLSGDDNDDGAWLGVFINAVPSELSAQLDLKWGQGVLILDVVADGPAELAGIERNDVILSLDGESLSMGLGGFAKLVGDKEPGDTIDIRVLRGGAPRTIEVKLGVRPSSYTWRFHGAGDDDEEVEDTLLTTGRIILQDSSGKWVVRDLREIDEIVDLGDDIKALIPQIGTMSKFVRKGDGGHSFQIHVSHNGQNMTISRENDGEITVTRRDEDGEENTTVYDSEDELRDADEEAFSVYLQPHGTFAFRFGAGDSGDFGNLADLHVKLKGMKFDTEALHGRIRAHIAKVQESTHDALKGLHELHFEIDGTDFDWPDMLKSHGEWRKHFDAGQHAFALRFGKPRHTFEVRDDGSIEVRIRKGDSALLRRFESADDLADRNPRLFEKYEKLMEADQNE